MDVQKIKYILLDLRSDNIYGLRTEYPNLFIGNSRVEICEDRLSINQENFILTDGLLELLAQRKPRGYSNSDLIEYRKILLLTSVHKRNFKPNERIVSTRSYKYTRIISKLFPPRRRPNILKKRTRTSEEKMNEHQKGNAVKLFGNWFHHSR